MSSTHKIRHKSGCKVLWNEKGFAPFSVDWNVKSENFNKGQKMKIRRAVPGDMKNIFAIYAYARQQMRLAGNPDQWGDSHPSMEIVQKDIADGSSYVVTDEKDEICAVFAFIIGEEPTYRKIENGHWLSDDAYGTLHRVASSGRQKGILKLCLAYCEAKMPNVRVDTHGQNRIMQHLLEKNGYQRCGIIHVADGSPRIAYQKKG